MTRIADPTWLYATCLEHTAAVHPWDTIDHDYARARAELVMRTLGMESAYQHRRQLSISHPEGYVGGNGLCQIEYPTLVTVLNRLDKQPVLAERFRDWLFGPMTNPYPVQWYRIEGCGANALLWQVRSDDRLAVALCSMVYLLAPGKVPTQVETQFEYWLAFYNGRGCLKHRTRAQALKSWEAITW